MIYLSKIDYMKGIYYVKKNLKFLISLVNSYKQLSELLSYHVFSNNECQTHF